MSPEPAASGNDRSLIESHLSEDVVYDVRFEAFAAEPIEGRDALLLYFKCVLDRLDRRFDSRGLNLFEGPVEEDDLLWIRGAATYRAEGSPELVHALEETIHFEDGLSCRIVD